MAEQCDMVVIGTEPRGGVLMKSAISSQRVADMLAGEMLPRIC